MKKIVGLFVLFFVFNYALPQSVSNCQKTKSQLSVLSLYYSPENHRSDTFDVIHYDIHISVTYTPTQIAGHTIAKVTPKMNNQTSVRFDLLKLIIDSIKVNNQITTYFYNDTLLQVNFPTTKNIGDTILTDVFYHGMPQTDPSGWGGFYFNGNYAFNLGVGFASLPHNFGRVWFPCFDNFVEKSTYDFYITSDSLKSAYCNGLLINETFQLGKRTRHWQLIKEIPSYLASMAVADYTQVNMLITTPTTTVPAIIAARPTDTNGVKTAFIHLPNAVNIFESRYGTYVWPRVGYCLVPFSSGAMEHATNIAYPQLAIGTTAYESQLMAHELSHHWWGDLITCETQEDMWLNEGMATFSEMIFLESMYGASQYYSQLMSALTDIIQFANFKEQQYWPVSGVSSQYTYGDHVYKKGSIVAHNLRTYLGDSLFFNGLKYVLVQKAYKNMNSAEFQSLLETYTGHTLSNFFQPWVFNGGYPVLIIDSAKYISVGGGNYQSQISINQKLHGAPAYYNQMPLSITYFDNNWAPHTYTALISGSLTTISHTLNFIPQFEILNYDKKLAYASVGDKQVIKGIGNFSFNNAKTSINVTNAGSDSSFMYIEHHFSAPDPQKSLIGKKYKLSKQHYWKISGKLSSGFKSKIRLNYNGMLTYSGYGCMDTSLCYINSDSITVLYRQDAAHDWREMTFTKYPSGQKAGMLLIDTLLIGEYTFANKNGYYNTAGIFDLNKCKEIKIYPNPSHQLINIEVPSGNKETEAYIYNAEMKLMKRLKLNNKKTIDISDLPCSTYVIIFYAEDKTFYGKFIKE